MENRELKHTAAHVLAQAMKRLYPDVKLGIGPAIEEGFYYDFDMEHRLSDEDLPRIEEEMKRVVDEDYRLRRQVVSKDEARQLFEDEPYKLEILEGLQDEEISVYRQGEFVDLCAGPHVERTGQVRHYRLVNVAGAYWRGDERRQVLQRVYGVVKETAKELEEELVRREAAAHADHRRLGRLLRIFTTSGVAAGEPFLLPRGLVMLAELVGWWRAEHRACGLRRVRLLQLCLSELFGCTSGD